MNMQSDFKRYAASLGIRDPLKVSQDLFNKCVSHKGSVTYVDEQSEEDKKLEPSKLERDQYIMMREKYVAERIFKEIGYPEFMQHTERSYNNALDEWRKSFLPCESADGQFFTRNTPPTMNDNGKGDLLDLANGGRAHPFPPPYTTQKGDTLW